MCAPAAFVLKKRRIRIRVVTPRVSESFSAACPDLKLSRRAQRPPQGPNENLGL